MTNGGLLQLCNREKFLFLLKFRVKIRGRDVLLAPFSMAIPDQEEPSSSSRHPPALCPFLFTMAERLKLFMAFVLGGVLLFS